MPNPLLSTIAESSLSDIDTTAADVWNLPPSYFSHSTSPAFPTSPTAGSGPPSPSSPYTCHFPSPLVHSFADAPNQNNKSVTTTGSGLRCESPCLEGSACRFHNAEHPFHRRRKSLSAGVWTPMVDMREAIAVEAEKRRMVALSFWLPYKFASGTRTP